MTTNALIEMNLNGQIESCDRRLGDLPATLLAPKSDACMDRDASKFNRPLDASKPKTPPDQPFQTAFFKELQSSPNKFVSF